MSLYKRNNSPNWYYRLTPPGGGPVVQGSTGTSNKAHAQELYDRLKVELWNQAKLGHKPRYLWNDAVVRYVGDREGLSSLETSKTHLRWLDPHLSGVALADIDRDRVDAIAHAKRCEPRVVRTRNGPKPIGGTIGEGTVRRVIGVLMAVLHAAVEWEWLDRAPVLKRRKTTPKRVRWITRPSRAFARRVAGSSVRHGVLQPRDWLTPFECNGAGMVAGRPRSPRRLDSPGPGEGKEGDHGAAVGHGG